MRTLLLVFNLILLWTAAQAESGLVCHYWGKDYDSPGFGIPYRSGFYLKARFGCNYRCTCPNGTMTALTYVLEEKHFSLKIFSEQTGGPSVAKKFICPQSVKENTWKPIRDELGHVIAYNVEINDRPFPAERLSHLPVVKQWAESCEP